MHDGGGDAEVFDGRFPRSEGVAGELDALFGPGAEVVLGEDGEEGIGSGAIIRRERR